MNSPSISNKSTNNNSWKSKITYGNYERINNNNSWGNNNNSLGNCRNLGKNKE